MAMAQAMKKIILCFNIVLFILFVLSVLVVSGYTYLKAHIYSKETFEKNYSQLHNMREKDEYVVAEAENQETFNLSEYAYILGDIPIGASEVEQSLMAHYKYFIKLSELVLQLEGRTLIIEIPKLHLSKPVAFNTKTFVKRGETYLFGAPLLQHYMKRY